MRLISVHMLRLVMDERMKSKKWNKSKEARQELKWIMDAAWDLDYCDPVDNRYNSCKRSRIGSNRAKSQLSLSSSMIFGAMSADLGLSHFRIYRANHYIRSMHCA